MLYKQITAGLSIVLIVILSSCSINVSAADIASVPTEQEIHDQIGLIGKKATRIIATDLVVTASPIPLPTERFPVACAGDSCTAILPTGPLPYNTVQATTFTSEQHSETIEIRNGVNLRETRGSDEAFGVVDFRGLGGWMEYSTFSTDRSTFGNGVRWIGSGSAGQHNAARISGEGMFQWTGAMSGFDKLADEDPLIGDVTFTLDVVNQVLDLTFTNIATLDNSRKYDDMIWNDVPVGDGYFSLGAAKDSLSGYFYGPNHEEISGVFERRHIVGAFGANQSLLAVKPARAQNEAICKAVGGNFATQTCTGSDYTGIRYSPQDVPEGGLDLTVMGGSDAAGFITIIGEGLQVPLPNGQSIEVMDHGISLASAGASEISVTLDGYARVQTDGLGGHGIHVRQYLAGPLNVTVNGGPITTGGQNAHGVNAEHLGKGDISITLGENADITAKREGSNAVQALQNNDGSVTVRVEEGAVLRGAGGLGRGIAAFLMNDSNSGRIVIDNKGTITGGPLGEGILAWARRRSGHIGYTREDGGRQAPLQIMADETRTNPLIHVVSSGTIRVGDRSIVGLPAQPDPQSLAFTINLGIVNGLLNPPLAPAGAGIRAYAVDLVDLVEHVATPKILSPAQLEILATQLQIPAAPGLMPAQILAGALGAVDPQGNPLPVKILSLAEADAIREVLDDTGEDRLDEVLDNLSLAASPEYTEAYKNKVREFEGNYNAGDILIEVTGGSVTSLDGYGIHAGYPIPSSMRNGEISISVSEGASVTGYIDGIRLATGGIEDEMRQHFVHVAGEVTGQTGVGVHPVAGGEVTVARTGKISGHTGIYFAGGTGNGNFPITNNVARVYGEVGSTGPLLQTITDPLTQVVTNVRHAGIKFEGGGKVLVGPHARITAQSGVAILGEPWSVKPNVPANLEVVIEQGEKIEQRIQGAIRNLPGADGTTRAPRIYVQSEDRALLLTEGSKMPLGGVWDVSFLQTDNGDISLTSEYGARAQVYEALPFVLAEQPRLATYHERIDSARDATGFWIRPTYGGGKWNAKTSTYGGTGYDYDHYQLEGGIDISAGRHFTLGVAAHHRRSSAELSGSGAITVAGEGLGLTTTFDNGRYYVDSLIAVSWHRLDMDDTSFGAIASDVSGDGYALGLEVGRRVEMDGFSLTPKTGLSYSSFELDDFVASLATGGGAVSVGSTENMRGRVGLLLEKVNKEERRLFASVDIEQHFVGTKKSISIADTKLSARAHPTRVRMRLGGSLRLSERVPLLQGSLRFAAAENNNYDLLGQIKIKFNF